MYRCMVTGRMSRRGEKLNRLVVETRKRSYTKKVKNEETNKWEEVHAGIGWEIVREINASTKGKEIFDAMTEDEREEFVDSL